jgi:hypothetical protein
MRIYLVQEKDWEPYLTDFEPYRGETVLAEYDRPEQVELDDLVDMMFQSAEAANYHDIERLPQRLAELFTQHASEQVAKSVLWDLLPGWPESFG